MEQQHLHGSAPSLSAPRFYLTAREPIRPGAIVLATVLALAALFLVLFALGQSRRARLQAEEKAGRSATTAGAAGPADDKDDDPSQVDTIVLGDPADAPVPARKGDHVSPVHPTILVRLPRFGDEVGLIPDTGAGRLLYRWLAAFNQGSATALADALPTMAEGAVAGQMELRRETGGFTLISAKEVQPGVLVFRLHDQTPSAAESLGTLVVRGSTNPPAIASFSLRAVSLPRGTF